MDTGSLMDVGVISALACVVAVIVLLQVRLHDGAGLMFALKVPITLQVLVTGLVLFAMGRFGVTPASIAIAVVLALATSIVATMVIRRRVIQPTLTLAADVP